MNIYDLFMKPLEDNGLSYMRSNLIKSAEGTVLELGTGTGVNLDYYNYDKLKKLILSDLNLRNIVKNKYIELSNFSNVSYVYLDVHNINLEDNSVDTVVSTLVFCSVDDVAIGLKEIQRVLKPNGKLIFIEHVISPDKKLANIMNIVTPTWKKIASGCCLNRDYITSLEENGFEIKTLDKRFKEIFVGGIAEKRV